MKDIFELDNLHKLHQPRKTSTIKFEAIFLTTTLFLRSNTIANKANKTYFQTLYIINTRDNPSIKLEHCSPI